MHPSLEIDALTGAPKCCNCRHWVAVPGRAIGQCTKNKIETLDLARCTRWDAAEDVEIQVKKGATTDDR